MTLDLQFFDQIQTNMDAEASIKDEIRQAVRELEKSCRAISAILNQVHSSLASEVPLIVQSSWSQFPTVRANLQTLAALVPERLYYRYNDQWSRALQQACFLAAFTTYLEHERLITIPEVEQIIGVPLNLQNNPSINHVFHITLEDLLHSFISVTNELSRLAVNSVTAGDYSRPLRVSRFVHELASGFQLLNLKNDGLRKRFDGIKYDVKKIEEVVYDISLRGLNRQADSAEA
jgi:predicted translin family RNA/ssDNA-binding protein